jgi:23S rRNA-/tRNA-specific pseudouridylate synthase
VQVPASLAEVVGQLAPEDSGAVTEGRVFVNRARVRDPLSALLPGAVVSLHAPRPKALESLRILGETEGILVVHKPPSFATEPDASGASQSLREVLERETGRDSLHVVTRLDVGVSGLVVLATDARSRAHLQKLVGTIQFHREYLGLAAGELPPGGRWEGSVDERQGRARPARTEFTCLVHRTTNCRKVGSRDEQPLSASLVWVRPTTGRRHQIRIHTSRAGAPLFGDRRYGGPHELVMPDGHVQTVARVMLHAWRLRIACPSGRIWKVESPLPDDLHQLWAELGGEPLSLP